MSPSQGTGAADVGPSLFQSGCRQGALIDAPAQTMWLTRVGEDQGWSSTDDTVADALLIAVSQDCDIYASPKAEPRVEAMTARWTKDRNEIHTARKGNSTRLFLLQESDDKALVADARRRVQIDKNALRGMTFKPAFEDQRTRTRFARWVAGRYDRPAIANELVDAVQKPIVSAMNTLVSKNETLLGILKRVAELRFSVGVGQAPWTLHLMGMIDEEDELSAEEEAELGGWLEEVLVVEGGPIKDIALAFRTESNISLRDYLQTTHLQLDHFSPEADAEFAPIAPS